MNDMPFCLGSGPRVTGTATGNGAAKEAGRRERRERNAEVLITNGEGARKGAGGWVEKLR